jgi:hypothetical protein
MMNDTEARIRCLELAERIQMRVHDNDVEKIIAMYKKLYYTVFTEGTPVSVTTPEEESKSNRMVPTNQAVSSSSALQNKTGK